MWNCPNGFCGLVQSQPMQGTRVEPPSNPRLERVTLIGAQPGVSQGSQHTLSPHSLRGLKITILVVTWPKSGQIQSIYLTFT